MEGFPRKCRLRTRREFRLVLDRGLSKVSRTLVVYGRPSSRHRIGLIVSKRVGSAVTRNRVKRVLRECFRRRAPLVVGGTGIDFVVIARRAAVASVSLPADLHRHMLALNRKINSGPNAKK